LVLTSLPLAHALFCVAPSPHLARLTSLELSLNIRFTHLHGGKLAHVQNVQQQPTHRLSASEQSHVSTGGSSHQSMTPSPQKTAPPYPPTSAGAAASAATLPWPALCAELSRLAETGSLRRLAVCLDVADRDDDDVDGSSSSSSSSYRQHAGSSGGSSWPSSFPAATTAPAAFAALDPDDRHDRFWWEVRETWALGGLSAALRRRTRVRLPEVTVDVPRMRAYQFRTTSNNTASSSSSFSSSSSASSVSARLSAADRSSSSSSSCSQLRLDASPPFQSTARPSDAMRVAPDEFEALERYPRRRWKREDGCGFAVEGLGIRDGVQARLEFFSPREHVPETAMVLGGGSSGSWGNNNKMAYVLRGMLIC
jgi:hypothetical protein